MWPFAMEHFRAARVSGFMLDDLIQIGVPSSEVIIAIETKISLINVKLSWPLPDW